MYNVQFFQTNDRYDGIAIDSLRGLQRLVKDVGENIEIKSYKAPDLSYKWDNFFNRNIFIFPGGENIKWNKVFARHDLINLKLGINLKDSYYGCCAGADFASTKSTYEDLYETINQDHLLSLFPGHYYSPLIPTNCPKNALNYNEDPKDTVGALLAEVEWLETKETGLVILHGGGYFKTDPEYIDDVEVLAIFKSIPELNLEIPDEKQAAVVCYKRAVLSSVHWEYNSEDFPNISNFATNPDLKNKILHLQTGLDQSKGFRKTCFQKIWNRLIG